MVVENSVEVYVNRGYLSEKEYIAKVVFEQWLHLPVIFHPTLPTHCHEWRIRYRGALLVFPDVFFAEVQSMNSSDISRILNELSLCNCKNSSIELFGPFAKTGEKYDSRIDIFGSAFFFLSRFEDVYSIEKDKFGRVREETLFLVQNQLEKKCIVDDYVRFIAFKLDIPHYENYAAKDLIDISFDVDYVKKLNSMSAIAKSLGGHLFKRKSLERIIEDVKAVTRIGLDPYDKVEEAISLALRYSKGSRFYFMALEEGEEDFRYSLKSKKLGSWIQNVKKARFEVGFHPSRKAATNEEQFHLEMNRACKAADQEIHHSRQHFLCFTPDKTIDLLESNGITEDASTGFSRHIGYRTGTSLSYSLYNYSKKRASSVITKPFQIMDVALLHLHTKGLDIERLVFDVCSHQVRNGKPLSLLWHPHNIGAYEFCSKKIDLEHVLKVIERGMNQKRDS